MNTTQTTGTRFRGTSVELEQSSIFYINGDEFITKNEILNLKELLIIKEDTTFPESISNIKWKSVGYKWGPGTFP